MAKKKKQTNKKQRKTADQKTRFNAVEQPSDEPRTDSAGQAIPTEKDRKANKAKIISFDDVKNKHDPKRKRVARAKGFKGKGKKRKVKYVLDASAKKWLYKVVGIAVVFVLALVIAIIALNQQEQARKNEVKTLTVDDTTISMVGMTPQGKFLIDGINKFDGFFEIEGIDAAKLYDNDITAQEELILGERNQNIRNGIVHYNEELSLSAKIEAEKAAEEVALEEAGDETSNGIIPPKIDLNNLSEG